METGMTIAQMPLAKAAEAIPTDPSCLRRALNRFGLVDRQDDGQRVIDTRIVALFAQNKRASGYLYPKAIDTLDKLLAAASAIKAPQR
jgi:hypothetical protein